jgi:putative ABC transport system permease protein
VLVWFRQTGAVTLLNLRTIHQRLSASAVAIIGIAGVVVVLVSVLSIGQGFEASMRNASSPLRAMVMRTGADTELTSFLGGDAVDIIKQAPGLMTDGRVPLASAELYVIINLPKRSTNTPANVPMRGVESLVLQVRDQISIVTGRMFSFGTNEVIAGVAANGQFAGLDVGDTIQSGQQTWEVVGLFEADGGVSETEVWADARILQGVYRRGNSFQLVTTRLESTASFATFSDWLTSNPQLEVQVQRETDYYAAQSRTISILIRTIGFTIAALMGIGAIFGAILTMYTTVASRAREIAMLRALGFNAGSVVTSVLVESLALGAVGGVLGGAVAYLGFNGYQTSTMNFQSFSQVAFAFQVTPRLLTSGLIYALLLGLAGGLLPAIRAAYLPIPAALREL